MHFFFVLLFARFTIADEKPPCGPTDWFIYNLKHSVYQPFLDKFSYILHAPPLPPPPRSGGGGKEAQHPSLPINQGTCESIGLYGGLDVMHVLFKIYSGGFVLPIPAAIQDYLFVFDICTEHVSRADFVEQKLNKQPHVLAFKRECERATMLFHCAVFHVSYTVPWLIMAAVVWVLFTVVGCAWLVAVCF